MKINNDIEKQILANKQKKITNLCNEENRNKLTKKIDDIICDFTLTFLDQNIIAKIDEEYNNLNIKQRLDSLFKGEKINHTEGRSVLHFLQRKFDPHNVFTSKLKEINETYDRIFSLSEKFGKDLKLIDGNVANHIIHIGIGGSNLGPKMLTNIFLSKEDRAKITYISNIDNDELFDNLANIDLRKSMICIASKSFTTSETLVNAKKIIEIFKKQNPNLSKQDFIKNNFFALTCNKEKASEFGVVENNIFLFDENIGGRYSLFSTVSLPFFIIAGKEKIEELLAGACSIDEYCSNQEKNVIFYLAYLSVINRNILNIPNEAIIPYSYLLRDLPFYLQQLIMESNGKSISNKKIVTYKTSPFIFGLSGTDCQHSFFQQFHQGTDDIYTNFIFSMTPQYATENHKLLFANFLAQREALAFGNDVSENESKIEQKYYPGNRQSSAIIIPDYSPFFIGALIAIYEYITIFQGFIYEINSFDQFGVELGKKLANEYVANINDIKYDYNRLIIEEFNNKNEK